MLRLIVPIVLLLLGLGAGVGAGVFLHQPTPDTPTDGEADVSDTPADADHGPDKTTEPSRGQGSEHDGGHVGAPEPHGAHSAAPGSAERSEFVGLNNQFVVPIVRNGAVRSLVILSLTVEVDLGHTEFVYTQEPRLRDAFLQVLFAHANAGGFDGSFTQASAMDPLRAGLRDAARQALGEILRNVLIVDITRQDA